MDKSDLQETLFTLYLRLNGYFVTGFIVHAAQGNTTEIDALAVRFPFHKEPEREIGTCEHLYVSEEKIDLIICEVKGGRNAANFNYAFRSNKNAVVSVLNRFGAFNDDKISVLADQILDSINHVNINKADCIPVVKLDNSDYQVRSILVVPEQTRPSNKAKPYIYGDDIINYIWSCFRPENKREACGVVYNWSLWGEQYQKLVEYFKDNRRMTPGSIDEIYKYFGLSKNS